MKIIITGGHHTSALPVISEIQARDKDTQIFWLGHKHSIHGDKNNTLEYQEITTLKIPFFELKAGKLYKTKSILRLLRIPFGFIQAFILVLKIRPDVVLSFGGYLAAPVVFASFILGIPSITHEQTVVLGYANKFISHFVSKVLLTWETSKKYFKNQEVLVTGLPLRKEIFNAQTNNFMLNPSLPTLYITSGKTGSHIINQVVLESLEDLLNICNVIHQCGDTSFNNDFEKLKTKYEELKVLGKYNLRKFVFANEIGEAFSKSQLVLGRAGAHMVYELLALKKPAVLIPIPWVSHNEQNENAWLLEKCGLGLILNEKDLTPDSLISVLKKGFKGLDNINYEKVPMVELNAEEKIVNEIFNTITKK